MRSRQKAKGRRTSGSFLALPHAVLRSPSFLALSAPAVKLVLDIAVAYNGGNNGDLAATWNQMKARGWKSRQSLSKALSELRHHGLLELTRQGGMHKPSLYALTWLGIDPCDGKLEVPANAVPSGLWKVTAEPLEKTKRQHAPRVDSSLNDTPGVSIPSPEAPDRHAGSVVRGHSGPAIDTPGVSLLRYLPGRGLASGVSPSGSQPKRGRPQGETREAPAKSATAATSATGAQVRA